MKSIDKILIIPDIHHQCKKVARIINRHTDWEIGKSIGAFDTLARDFDRENEKYYTKVDKVIQIGDFFDDFNDTPQIAQKTATFICELLENPNFIWLAGNHDTAVMYCKGKGSFYGCSGFTFEKQKIIQSVMGDRLYENQLAYWTGITPTDPNGFLLSHAGLHPSYLPYIPGQTIYNFNWNWLEGRLKEAQIRAKSGIPDCFLAAGTIRGGSEPYGGITWLDWSDFEPIAGIRQIVGHTRNYAPRRIIDANGDDNWCLDTHLNHYGILTIEKGVDEKGSEFSIQKLQVYNLDGSLW